MKRAARKLLPALLGLAVVFYAVNRATEYGRAAVANRADTNTLIPGFFDFWTSSIWRLSMVQFDLIAGAIGIGVVLLILAYLHSMKQNTRTGEEQGSADWGGDKDRKILTEKDDELRLQLTETEALSMDTSKHFRNLNVLVYGGTGSGKSKHYVIPNMLRLGCSFAATDPKRELYKATAPALRDRGYSTPILDLIDLKKSDSFNPFRYFKADAPETSILELAENMVTNTTGKKPSGAGEFFDRAEKALLTALVAYVWATTPTDENGEPNLVAVADLQRRMVAYEGDQADQAATVDFEIAAARELLAAWDGGPAPEGVDEAELADPPDQEVRDVLAFATRQYAIYEQGAGETKKSVLISLGVRLAILDMNDVRRILSTDTIGLDRVGFEKQAVYLALPDTTKAFTVIASLFWQSFFQVNVYLADNQPDQKLPRQVHAFLDEFANIGKIPDYEQLISTIRSRGISNSVILQAESQGKSLYGDDWPTIDANCDSLLYLGSRDSGTHKTISELLGDQTIISKESSRSYGASGGWSKNDRNLGRKLLTPDEVGRLDIDEAILLVRGLRPFRSKKAPMVKRRARRLARADAS